MDGKHVTYSSAGYAASSYTEAAPSSALLKALLIGSTSPLPYGYPTTVSNFFSYSYGDLTRLDDMYDGTSGETYKLGTNGVDFTAGFGHVRMSNVFSIGGDFDTFLFEATLEEYSSWARTYEVTDVETEVDVTLVWNDPPGGSYCGFYFDNGMSDDPCLVHDLDLVVTHAGTRLYPNFGAASVGDYSGEDDMYNNAEKVTIDASSLAVGDMIKVEVRTNGLSYASSQKFAVVATGAMSANESPTPSPVVAATMPAPIPAPTLVPTPLRSCEESCSERPEVLEAYNNQDLASFCALDYSCAANCDTPSYAMMDAMCVCGSDLSYSYSFGIFDIGPEMCCGSGTCKAALFGAMTSMIDDDFPLDDAQDDDFIVKLYWDLESSGCTNYDCPSPTPEPTKSDTLYTGTCYKGSSMVEVLRGGMGASLELSQVHVGDMVRVSSPGQVPAYAKVLDLPHSPSKGSFVGVKTRGVDEEDMEAVVTPHHTFPSCFAHGKAVAAKHLKVGDCVNTVNGRRKVRKLNEMAALPGDETFSVELEGTADVLALGGIFTHASPSAHQKKIAVAAAKTYMGKQAKHIVARSADKSKASVQKSYKKLRGAKPE